MSHVPDSADNLRVGDRFFSRTTVTKWPKPLGVKLSKAGYLPLSDLDPTVYLYGLKYSRLTIRFPAPNPTKAPAYVRPPASMLDEFMRLSGANDERIRDYCARYGGLLVFCVLTESKAEELKAVEFCDVWRYFAGAVKALLRIAANLQNGASTVANDWKTIADMPPMVEAFQKERRVDLASPAQIQGEGGWTSLARMAASVRGRKRNWHMWLWADLLNSLLDLGRVRPVVLWDGPNSTADFPPRLAHNAPSLLSHVALQTCLLAVRRESFALCSYCNREYLPSRRAPKAGQRSFCPDCRAKRIPALLAKRDHRARKRESRESR